MNKKQQKEKYFKSIQNLKKLDEKIKIEKERIMKLQNIMIECTKEEVCKNYNVTMMQMVSKDRHGNFVLPRQILMYKLREIGLSLKKIGYILNRDHTTIMHGIKTIHNQKDFYSDIKLD